MVVVALGALANGASPQSVSLAFGDGFWSLITFTMQMAFVVIGGYVVAVSAPAAALIRRLAAAPKNGVTAVGMVAAVAMFASLLNWGLSLIFTGLLVLALARRRDLKMDFRAAGAAAYLGSRRDLGARAFVFRRPASGQWGEPAQSPAADHRRHPLHRNDLSLAIHGRHRHPYRHLNRHRDVFRARAESAVTAEAMGVEVPAEKSADVAPPAQPGDWLEYSPILTVLLVIFGAGWIIHEFARQSWIVGISNLNSYNFIFIMAGLLLHWRPKRFLDAVKNAVPATSGVLIQFPLYGAIAAMLTQAKNGAGLSVSDQIAHAFVSFTTEHTYPLAIGLYSAVLGFFVPSGGGKWLLEAPYLMQAANDLNVHLGWAVQVYNAAEALPNLINPFWMLPLLGVLGLRARNIVGFTFLQLIVHLPLTLFLLWAFAFTLTYHPPVMP